MDVETGLFIGALIGGVGTLLGIAVLVYLGARALFRHLMGGK